MLPALNRIATSYDRVRASADPAYDAQLKIESATRRVDAAVARGLITQDEAASTLANVRRKHEELAGAAVKSTASNDNFARSTGLARHELINLSRQVQDVGVSLSSGQSPFTVLVQQGSQVADIFASSQSTVGSFFRQAGAWLGGFLTAGRVAFGGVVAAVLTGVTALGSYVDAQREVQRSLTGIGRASGLTVAGVNSIASAGASPLGFSVSEAREFASVLAATGKVGRDEIGALVKLGHDFATTLGVEGKDAAQQLARAMADPVRGAEQLNERLGFMDAAQQRQIKNLVEQNRLGEAQRIIIAGIRDGIASSSELTGFWSKTWTAISNAISNSYDGLGRILSRATGIGSTLEEQLEAAKSKLDNMKALGADKSILAGTMFGPDVSGAQADVDRLTKKLDDNRAAAEAARQRIESFRVATAALNFLPEIEQLQHLKNTQDLLVRTMIDVQVSGGPASEILKRLGLTYEQLSRSLAIATDGVDRFKTSFEAMSVQSKIASDPVTAFSPAAKAAIAYRQTEEQLRRNTDLSVEEKLRTAQEAYALSLKQSTVAISEQARERELSAKQSVLNALIEVALIAAKSDKEQHGRPVPPPANDNATTKPSLERKAA